MPEKITEGTINCDNLQVDNLANNLVKTVTVTEWNALQNTLNLLRSQISMLVGSTLNTNKQEEK